MARALGRAALTFAGSFFGPWGTLIGGLVGGLLFPEPGPKGPRLNELNIQHSTVGAPIPITYGTTVLAGNVIWSGGLEETQHESGGKGGPSGPTTYSYACSLALGLAEGPITSLRRLWADADLIYDATDDTTLEARLTLGGVSPADIAATIQGIRALSAQLQFTLYLGDETQLPDPTIESFVGVGITPAYRGLAYLVLPDFQLEKYGNRIPNFRAEITTTGTATDCGIYSAGQLLPWNDGLGLDPRVDEGVYEYSADGVTWVADAQTALSSKEDPYGGNRAGTYLLNDPHGFSEVSCLNCLHSDCESKDLNDKVSIAWYFNSITTGDTDCFAFAEAGGVPFSNALIARYGLDSVYRWGGEYNTAGAGNFFGTGYFVNMSSSSLSETSFFSGYYQPGSGDMGGGREHQYLYDVPIFVRRSVQPPDPCSLGTPLAGAPGYCVIGGVVTRGITWTLVSGTFKVLQAYTTAGSPAYVTKYPLNPALASTDPNYSNQAYWEAAYAEAVANGELVSDGVPIPGDWVYGVDYPTVTSSAYFSDCDTLDVECVPMAVIVADICRRAGLRTDTSTQIDVSDLTTCVEGYIIGRQMSARDALQPLRTFGLWDAVESDALLKFIERGHALVETLTADDLGAHEYGSEPPSLVEVSRTQEKDLPRRVRLHFPNFLHDHEVSEQAASRLSTEAIDEIDIELAVSMEPDTGKQLAEIILYEAWVSRNAYKFSLDNDWLQLEPTDCVEIPVDGQTERVRIVSVDYKIGGLLEISGVRDDGDGYSSTAIANDPTPSGGLPGSSGGGPICGSGVVLLDIPRLRPEDTDAGYYAAIYGLCADFWNCAELYRSNDGGATYGRVARTDFETTVGEIVTITGPATDPTLPGDSPPYDTTSAITVNLFEGTLSSITDAQIAAGQNLAAIGVHGRWVLIQFKTATLDTGDQWTLTDLIWGINDTEHLLSTTVAEDTFVLLSDPDLLRIPESADAIGVAKQLKVISCGETLDDTDPISFTTQGLSYARLCPSTVISASVTDPPGSHADGEAYLLPNDTSLSGVWANHNGEIATWSDETDSWVFCTPAPGTVIIIEDDPGGPVISPGGGGTPTPAPWTPAIPPLPVIDTTGDLDTSYFVAWTGTEYVKVLGADMGGGGGGTVASVTGLGGVTVDNTDPANPVVSITAGDRGDITTSGTGGTTWTIDNDAVTYAKIQDVTTTDRILGRDTAGSGIIEELTLSQVLDFVGSAAQGDILYRGSSAWARLAAGTSGRFLKTQGSGADPVWSIVSAAAGGAMTYLGRVTVAGAAATSITFSGLDLTNDNMYFWVGKVSNATGGNITVTQTFNSDTTAGNYDNEAIGASGASLGSTGNNNPTITGNIATGDQVCFKAWTCFGLNAQAQSTILMNGINNATRISRYVELQWRTATNVTQFVLTSSVASGFNIGSFVDVWKITL